MLQSALNQLPPKNAFIFLILILQFNVIKKRNATLSIDKAAENPSKRQGVNFEYVMELIYR